MAKHTNLPSAINFQYGVGKWWGAHIQSYACLRSTLRNAGLHQHHLIPKSLIEKGPYKTHFLIDYVPSVTLDQMEHLSSVHEELNAYLTTMGVWQVSLTQSRLEEAINFTRDFYMRHGIYHFSEAIDEFIEKLYSKVQ